MLAVDAYMLLYLVLMGCMWSLLCSVHTSCFIPPTTTWQYPPPPPAHTFMSLGQHSVNHCPQMLCCSSHTTCSTPPPPPTTGPAQC